MKKAALFSLLLIGAVLCVSAPVEARHHHRHHCRNSFGFNFGMFAPAYYAPPPPPVVYYCPPPYPQPCPQTVYVMPQPVYVQPGFSFGWSFFR